MAASEPGEGDGRISLRLRIGVTGHREIADSVQAAAQVRRAVERIHGIVRNSSSTPVYFTVVSPIAEGADQLVADEVLRTPGAQLEVPLPLDRDRYFELSFSSVAGRQRFAELFARANVVISPPDLTEATASFEAVSRYVVTSSDLLIALWNGEHSDRRGGTATTIAFARSRGLPMVLIPVGGDAPILEERVPDNFLLLFEDLAYYNRQALSMDRHHQEAAEWARHLVMVAKDTGCDADAVAAVAEWAAPFQARADLLARRFQRLYEWLGAAAFVLAATAVVVAAIQVLLWPERPQLALVEVGLMALLVPLVLVGRRWRLRDRWVTYRFLAERFRSAPFLLLAGMRDRLSTGAVTTGRGRGASEPWLQRAFSEVWALRPSLDANQVDSGGLRRFLASAWIDERAAYYVRASHHQRTAHVRLTWASHCMFGATFLAATLHALGVGGDHHAGTLSVSNFLILAGIGLPAFGGAISGIRVQREYLRHAERYQDMAELLKASSLKLADAERDQISNVAVEADEQMAHENGDWVGIMTFHDFEIHV